MPVYKKHIDGIEGNSFYIEIISNKLGMIILSLFI